MITLSIVDNILHQNSEIDDIDLISDRLKSRYVYGTSYILTITPEDTVKARLTKADRQLLNECNKDDASISDRLLGLELLVRRIEEGIIREEKKNKRKKKLSSTKPK